MDSLVCVDPDNGSSTAGATATIDLDAGETVTCTFSNSRDMGTVVIQKEADPEDDTEFNFTENIHGGGGMFALSDPSDNIEQFDDVGEMLVFMAENPEVTASVWVHDLNSAAWLPAGEAWFVMNSGLRTPMGTGIAVTADEQAARALAFDQPEAVVMTFAEIVAAAEAGELMNVHGME